MAIHWTIYLAILFLAIMLFADLYQINTLKKQIHTTDTISTEKYFELKWRINLMLSIVTVSGIILGLFGYSFQENLQSQINTLTSEKDSLSHEISVLEQRQTNLESSLSDKEKRILGLDNDMKILSVENRNFQSKMKNNIGKVYKELKEEEKSYIVAHLRSYPEQADKYLSLLMDYTYQDEYFKIFKEIYVKNPQVLGYDAGAIYASFLLKNFPSKTFRDKWLFNMSFDSYNQTPVFIKPEFWYKIIEDFVKYIYEFGGFEENIEKVKWLTYRLNWVFNKDKEIATYFYSQVKTKKEKFLIFKELPDGDVIGIKFGQLILREYEFEKNSVEEASILKGIKNNKKIMDYPSN